MGQQIQVGGISKYSKISGAMVRGVVCNIYIYLNKTHLAADCVLNLGDELPAAETETLTSEHFSTFAFDDD